jgi:hypothetical protein
MMNFDLVSSYQCEHFEVINSSTTITYNWVTNLNIGTKTFAWLVILIKL